MSGAGYRKLAAEAFREAERVPALVSARLLEASTDQLYIGTEWSQTSLAAYQNLRFARTVTVSRETLKGLHQTPSQQLQKTDLSVKKNDLMAQFKTSGDLEYFEVWNASNLTASFNLKDIDAHGKVYTDTEFGSLDMSADGRKLLYIAEKKAAKSLPFLHQGSVGEEAEVGTQYDYKEDWGEQLVGKVNPVIAVLDITSEGDQPAKIEIQQVENVAGSDGKTTLRDLFPMSPSEPWSASWSVGLVKFWNPSGQYAAPGIVGVAYRTYPRKLGKIYCSNRPAVLFFLDPEGNYHNLAGNKLDDTQAIGITDLTVSSETGRLVWFERTLSASLFPGPHRAGVRIMGLDTLGGESYEIYSQEQPVYTGDLSKSCGLFFPARPARCWQDNDTFYISEGQGGTVVPFRVNCATREVTPLTANPENLNVKVLDVCAGYILGCRSDLTTPSHLVIARTDTDKIEFKPVYPASGLPELEWRPFLIQDPSPVEGANFPFTALYVGPQAQKDGALIVWPHGGPHSQITASFNNTAAFFCKLGFSVLFVNYRGSIGLGEANVNSLPGRCGDMDVKDCHQATMRCLEEMPGLSPAKVFLMGGSHGGFLVTHLAGQYPDLYKGVVARNPVTNIATMSDVTDIPDWTLNEAGLPYTWTSPNPAQMEVMWKASPIAHIQNIRAPIFLMLGSKDLRVPHSNGLAFYHQLKALGKETRCHLYEDNHPLAKPEHNVNVMVSAAIFFQEIMEAAH